MRSRTTAEHVLTIEPDQNGKSPSFPPFSRRLAEAAFWVRATPVPSPFAVQEFREALCAYVHDLHAAGIARDQVARAIWPALTGIASPRVVDKTLTWCLEAYDSGNKGERPSPPSPGAREAAEGSREASSDLSRDLTSR